MRHRFVRDELVSAWGDDYYECHWCGKSGMDAMHHIVSPSSQDYKRVSCNNSILNSCPIHNTGCHLYNGKLHHREVEGRLLRKTIRTLLQRGYQLKKKDVEFFKTYERLYETN